MGSLQQMPSQSPVESRVQSPSPAPNLDAAKTPAMESSMTSLPSSLQEARSVQALNEKLQRKDDMIKMKQAQIKMLLAETERLKAGSSRQRAEIARLRAKLRMREHPSAAAMGMQLVDSDEVSDASRATSRNSSSAHEQTPFYSPPQVKSDRQVDGVNSCGVVYGQIDNGQEPVSPFIPSRPQSSASSRRKTPVTSAPAGKPKREEFHAGIVGSARQEFASRDQTYGCQRKHECETASQDPSKVVSAPGSPSKAT